MDWAPAAALKASGKGPDALLAEQGAQPLGSLQQGAQPKRSLAWGFVPPASCQPCRQATGTSSWHHLCPHQRGTGRHIAPGTQLCSSGPRKSQREATGTCQAAEGIACSLSWGVTTGKCSLAPRCRAQKWQFFHLHQPLPRPEGQAAWKCHPGAPTSLSNGSRCPHISPWDRVGGTEDRGTGRGQGIPLWQGKCFTHGREMAPRRARGSPTLQKGVTRGRGGGRGGSVVRGAPQQHQQPWHPLILAHRGGGGEARSCYFL